MNVLKKGEWKKYPVRRKDYVACEGGEVRETLYSGLVVIE